MERYINMVDIQVKIIADGPFLELLEEILKGSEFTHEFSQSGDRLVIYAHTITESIKQRSAHGGLKKLQEILSNPRSEPIDIVILGLKNFSFSAELMVTSNVEGLWLLLSKPL